MGQQNVQAEEVYSSNRMPRSVEGRPCMICHSGPRSSATTAGMAGCWMVCEKAYFSLCCVMVRLGTFEDVVRVLEGLFSAPSQDRAS